MSKSNVLYNYGGFKEAEIETEYERNLQKNIADFSNLFKLLYLDTNKSPVSISPLVFRCPKCLLTRNNVSGGFGMDTYRLKCHLEKSHKGDTNFPRTELVLAILPILDWIIKRGIVIK